jgi:hypothetical protein
LTQKTMDGNRSELLGFSGIIEWIQLENVIQLICLAQMRLILEVKSGDQRGEAFVISSAVVHAQTAELEAEQAFLDILRWENGEFETRPLIEEVTPSINRPWEYLLIEAFRLRGMRIEARLMADEDSLDDESVIGFKGKLEQIPLSDLIQLVCSANVDYLLELRGEEGAGSITIASGTVRHAVLSDLQGEDAFFKFHEWQGGTFTARLHPFDGVYSIEKPTEFLLTEVMRAQDERSCVNDGEEEGRADSFLKTLQKMKMIEKMRLATCGDREVRTYLIRDPSRLIQLAVISNPRISDTEVAAIAHSKSVDEEVLRRIANNREWVKNYMVRSALAKNPKTPLPIALKMVQTLQPQDLKLISRSRTVPQAIAQAAQRHTREKI